MSIMSEQRQHNLADIKDLSVSFMTDAGSIKAVENVNFTIPRKTVVGVVGESGSGKSVTARSIIKLLPETATTSGAVYLSRRDGSDGLDVLSLSGEQLRDMRGSEAAMVFQEPHSVLNPVSPISSPAVRSSASSSPWRWCSTPASSWPTSPPPLWT